MYYKRIIAGMAMSVGMLSVTYPFWDTQQIDQAYRQQIEQSRQQKDDFFKTSKQSPLTEKQRKKFQGLSYFPVDERYKVEARLEWLPVKQTVIIQTSSGKRSRYFRKATAYVSLHGKDYQLQLLQPDKPFPHPPGFDRTLHLAFVDQTSGKETYGGGRYLEVDAKEGSMSAVLDFNKAYNPFCAYNPEFDCILPLPENALTTSVEAGERYVP